MGITLSATRPRMKSFTVAVLIAVLCHVQASKTVQQSCNDRGGRCQLRNRFCGNLIDTAHCPARRTYCLDNGTGGNKKKSLSVKKGSGNNYNKNDKNIKRGKDKGVKK